MIPRQKLHINMNHFSGVDNKQANTFITQHAEWDLNKIEKTFNGTFAG